MPNQRPSRLTKERPNPNYERRGGPTYDNAGHPHEEIEDPVAELKRLEKVMQRRHWLDDPVAWAVERTGAYLWTAQRRIMAAIVQHRNVAVPSCHEVGKSHTAALVACWWLDAHKPGEAFVVTSAPTGQQVKAILWREIGRVHAAAKLPGRLNQAEWYLEKNGREELVAFGRKPDEYEPEAFQGIHAPFVLVIMDESCGIRGPLWEAADSLTANDASKKFAIGNPDIPGSEFEGICKPGSGWHVIPISAFDSPNFTGEEFPEDIKRQLIGKVYVEEKRRKWAPHWYWVDADNQPCEPDRGVRCVPPQGSTDIDTSPWWQSKILGRFPTVPEDQTLIPTLWIQAAQLRDLQPGFPNRIAQDVGGGGDESTIAHRQGPVVRIIRSDRNPDTMETCGNLLYALDSTGASDANVDEIGIGRGVVNRAQELHKPVKGVNVSSAPQDPEHFVNLRAELYWQVRTLFEAGQIDIDPQDDDLANELAAIRFKRNSTGKILIESKAEAKRRGVASPNRADALMLTFAEMTPRKWEAIW